MTRLEVGRADCIQTYEEALVLSERILDRVGAATCAYNLGTAFKDLPTLRDPNRAERWYRKSLDLRDERDRLGRGRCLHQLGMVAQDRFLEARAAGRPREEIFRHLNEAVELYHRALKLHPANAVNELAATHNELGVIYRQAGDLDRAVQHYRESIQLKEQSGNLYGAALTRFNVAIALFAAGRSAYALEYAETALRGFESFGERAAKEIEETRGLIAEILVPVPARLAPQHLV